MGKIGSFLKRLFTSYGESATESTQMQDDFTRTHPVDADAQENADAHPDISFKLFWHRF